jgi:LmbE family N-acetylglucosaminyl deacetylase
MPDRVLVLAPHPDDEAIGCGGAICLHRARGDVVRVVFLTSGEKGLPGVPEDEVRRLREWEAREAGRILGVERMDFLRLPDQGLSRSMEEGSARLTEILHGYVPRIIYLPHPMEAHPDHQAVLPLVRVALARIPFDTAPQLKCFEVWTPLTQVSAPVDVTAVMARKLRAVRCYLSQLGVVRYDRAVRGLDHFRGIMGGGCRYAEAFQEMNLHSS